MDTLWGPIDVNDWAATPVTIGRVACEEDVQAGNAVFYIPTGSEPYDVPLPFCARHTDDTGRTTTVVAIQAEVHEGAVAIGARFFDGGNMVCLLSELTEIERSKP